MSGPTAVKQSGNTRKPKRRDGERPLHERPIRVTLRRAKFASVLCIGGLMFGVVSNAMLLQDGHPPVLPAFSAVQTPPTVQRVATIPQAPIGVSANEQAPPPPAAPLASPGVDPMPTGAIGAAPRQHPKARPVTATSKPSSRPEDGISAFLRASTRSATASIR